MTASDQAVQAAGNQAATSPSEPRVIRQEGNRIEFYAKDPWYRRFPDGESIVPADARAKPLVIGFEKFQKRFNLRLCTRADSFSTLLPLHGLVSCDPDGTEYIEERPDRIEIWDLSATSAIVAWTIYEGRDGGGGNTHQKVCGTGAFTPEEIAWLMAQWNESRRRRALDLAYRNALKRRQLDHETIEFRRGRILETAGLDDAAIARKRSEVLRAADLDEETVDSARADIYEELSRDFEHQQDPKQEGAS